MEFSKSVRTGVNVEKQKFTWTIENFDLIRKSNELINSQRFNFKAGEIIGLPSDWTFYLQQSNIKKKGDQVEKNWIGCFLKLQKYPSVAVLEVNAGFQIRVLPKQKKTAFLGTSAISSFCKNGVQVNKGAGCGYKSIIPQDAELADLPLSDGCLVMEVEIKLFAPKSLLNNPLKDVEMIEEEFKSKFSNKLQEDLAKVFCNLSEKSNTTAKLVLEGKKEGFVVTRGILSARSPVFEKMFASDMKEGKTGIVQITEISSRTMSIILRFIYTGTLHENWRNADVLDELVYAAHKYQLSDLLDFLDQVVGIVCTKENAGKLYDLAKKMSMKTAEKELWEFMQKNISTFDDMVSFSKLPGDC